MIICLNLFVIIIAINAEPLRKIEALANSNFSETRRILRGHIVGETRPYMVYLRPSTSADPQITGTNWICGGVIIHERHILTSAACIEDAKHFYVVSGTHRWVPLNTKDDECINNGAKKAVWKCVPKNYFFDGNEFDNIRWMVHDIAIVKVEDDFNFERRVRGCDFIPNKIAFNNQSEELEKSGVIASIAGWGSTDGFGDVITRAATNSPVLLETEVAVISKRNCKKRWEERYHHIIDDHMICTKDGMDAEAMSTICSEQEVNCKELVYSEEQYEDETPSRRFMINPKELSVHGGAHFNDTRRSKSTGGFCENDHGGPLVVGQRKSAVVIGVISACLTKDLNHKCYGPFLFTSVWRNRHLINCAINKDIGATCRRLLSSTKTQINETVMSWKTHPDGPAKSEDVPAESGMNNNSRQNQPKDNV